MHARCADSRGGEWAQRREAHDRQVDLAATFRLLYLDLCGHGRFERVDPATLSPGRYAEDVNLMTYVERPEDDASAVRDFLRCRL